ncbi:MAG: hypothetical protein JSV25_14610 [Spirochaetota bacterium]|nr:MAG: hypothetical protein JSV25_14610 [Spirochaetota bacterium]
MSSFFSGPGTYFYWSDVVIALGVYILALILILKHKRGYITPVLFFGLFIFPLQFSIWFLSSKLPVALVSSGINFLEIFYLLLLKLTLLVSLLSLRR